MTETAGHRGSFADQMAQLDNVVLRLGTFAENMLARSITALVQQNLELAREVHRSDDVADDLNLQVERMAMGLLVSQQPVSRDLRAISGALRNSTDLERVADYAKDIAKIVIEVGDEPWFAPLEDTGKMGDVTLAMLRQALRAIADANVEMAVAVAAQDAEVDILWKKLWGQLLEWMQREPSAVRQAAYLILVARYLERIGDHVVNVLERLYYIETGKLEKLG